MAETAPVAPRLEPGLVFNEPHKRPLWVRLLVPLATPVAMVAGIGSVSWIAGEPLFAQVSWIIVVPMLAAALTEILFGGRAEHPIVEVVEGGLHVRGKLIAFSRITSIEARKVSTQLAVVSFNAGDAEGRITLLAPCESVQFRELLAELAAKAGVELTLKPQVKARRPRLPRAAPLAKA